MSSPVAPQAVEQPSAAGRSRGLALALAVIGLVGMFLTLLGWTAHVRDLAHTWGASPTLWLVLGGVLVVGAAIADAVLGTRADFVAADRPTSAAGTFLNRVLPWLIVVLTVVGMIVVSLVHG